MPTITTLDSKNYQRSKDDSQPSRGRFAVLSPMRRLFEGDVAAFAQLLYVHPSTKKYHYNQRMYGAWKQEKLVQGLQ